MVDDAALLNTILAFVATMTCGALVVLCTHALFPDMTFALWFVAVVSFTLGWYVSREISKEEFR